MYEYGHDPPDEFLKYLKNFEFFQFGGLRNEGFGVCRLIDHVKINVNDLKLPKKATHLTLISPVKYLPKYIEPYNCREEHIQLWSNNKLSNVKLFSAGQFFRLNNRRTIEKIALDGILRKNLLGKFGFGEFVLNNWEEKRFKKEIEPSSEQKINIPNDSELLDIQKHDLHKLKIKGFKPHKEALTESNMKRADGVAAWFSRSSDESEFDLENRFYIRDSYVLDLNKRYIRVKLLRSGKKSLRFLVKLILQNCMI